MPGEIAGEDARPAHVARDGDEIRVTAQARSFLHHQVRNMVGTLKLVGLHQWRPQHVAEALAARDRRAGGPMAPATGSTWPKLSTTRCRDAPAMIGGVNDQD